MKVAGFALIAMVLMSCGRQEFEGRWKMDLDLPNDYELFGNVIVVFEGGEIFYSHDEGDVFMDGTYYIQSKIGNLYTLECTDFMDFGNSEVEIEMLSDQLILIDGQPFERIE